MAAKLVTIGDSLTQGFQHGAVRRTEWSYPAMIARSMGAPFRQVSFDTPEGGPLLDIERLTRELQRRYGTSLDLWEVPGAALSIRSWMDRIEDHWERGEGTRPSTTGPLHHNLAVWGFEVLDALNLSDGACGRGMKSPRDNAVAQLVESAMYRTAQRVFNPSRSPALAELTTFDLARRIADDEGGIENLVVALGANNALGSCARLSMRWSQSADARKLAHQRDVTVWEPEHFAGLYDSLVERVKALSPTRVFVATVPHVTVAPVARGVSPTAKRNGTPERVDGYYEYYTRFFVWDKDFNPNVHPYITREDARAVDAAIDGYNAKITALAKANGYHLVPYGEVLDSLAFRRSGGHAQYTFPSGLVAALKRNSATAWRVRPDGTVLLDTRYFQVPETLPAESASSVEWQKAVKGGLFSLDGAHPTTIGYGVMAHELLKVMNAAGVTDADPARLDWDAIVAADSLVTDPPAMFRSLRSILGFVFGRPELARLIDLLGGIGSEPLR